MANEIAPTQRTELEPRISAAAPFKVFKPGQGIHVRWGTAFGAGVMALAGAAFLYEQLRLVGNLWVQNLVPAIVVVALGYVIFLLVGKRRTPVDFMIATEGEMKKVNWSSRKEVLGATKVVIFLILALATMFFIVDNFFILLFSGIGVLKIPIWENMFGVSVES